MADDQASFYQVGKVYDLPLCDIQPNPNQPRRSFEKDALEALKLSIAREGLLQPIAVLQGENGKWLIAAGERRFRAVQELGWPSVSARIVEGNVDDLAIMENMIREDLNPMERSLAMSSYLSKHKISRKKLSVILGIARNSISEILSLKKLPQDIQDIIIKDKRYSLHNMRIIARIRDPKEQRAKFEKLQAKIEGKEINITEEKEFKPDIKKKRIEKITMEIKHIQQSFNKQQLKQIKPQIISLYEQLQALLYKVGDDLFVKD
ncbi:MAG: ParB/RepB/Spo0J family partition protein [Desulfovibrio sp.]|nr:ParB/RepB/Spo0J family partition protein [Desulfovibrio sp.]